MKTSPEREFGFRLAAEGEYARKSLRQKGSLSITMKQLSQTMCTVLLKDALESWMIKFIRAEGVSRNNIPASLSGSRQRGKADLRKFAF